MSSGAATNLWILVPLAIVAVVALSIGVSRRWLSRTGTAITMLTIVAAFAAVGVFLGQNLPPDAYLERYGPVLGSLLVRSGLTSVFTSVYFVVAVTVFGLSVLACTFGRIVRLARARRRLPGIGSFVTHIALVVIIVGGIATGVGGFRRPADLYVGAGGEIAVPEGGFSLRVDQARTQFTDDGVVSEYVSEVTVIEDGREVESRRIEVNHPLVRNGIGVYQYEMLPSARSVDAVRLGIVYDDGAGGEEVGELDLPFREEVALPGTAISLKAVEFLSDFSYDIETGTAELVSVRHENPAVLVQVSEAGRILGERWAFVAVRGHDTGPDLPCRFFLLDYAPDFEHGLTRFEFTRQPGTPAIYAGFAALSLGLILTFWTRMGSPDAPGGRGRPAGKASGRTTRGGRG
jgi:hypothetical protein